MRYFLINLRFSSLVCILIGFLVVNPSLANQSIWLAEIAKFLNVDKGRLEYLNIEESMLLSISRLK